MRQILATHVSDHPLKILIYRYRLGIPNNNDIMGARLLVAYTCRHDSSEDAGRGYLRASGLWVGTR